jgi:protein-tyrosine phosphatase
MFREVKLPGAVAGGLFLHSMPGRYDVYEDVRQEIARCHIARVVCLAPLAEVQTKSLLYTQAIEATQPPWRQEMFPVPDYGVPEDCDTFWRLAQRVATALQSGERVLIHCGAGVGRTGMLAICVLLALGMTVDHARTAIGAAGSSPETSAQQEVITWAATRRRMGAT